MLAEIITNQIPKYSSGNIKKLLFHQKWLPYSKKDCLKESWIYSFYCTNYQFVSQKFWVFFFLFLSGFWLLFSFKYALHVVYRGPRVGIGSSWVVTLKWWEGR
jgi:hypothetical protein